MTNTRLTGGASGSVSTITLIACAMSVGCPSTSTSQSAPAHTAVQPGSTPRDEDPIAEKAEPIGFATLPPTPSRTAQRLNQEALEEHRRGNHADAARGFRAAMTDSPSFALARYNLACALSRQGEHDEASAHLHRLVHEDLPSFGSRIEEDEDLVDLRSSPPGRGLLASAATLRGAWLAALDEGTPVVVHRRHVPDDGQRYRALTWPGVYSPSTRRFVPMVPPISKTGRLRGCGGACAPTSAVLTHAATRTVVVSYAGWAYNHGLQEVGFELYEAISGQFRDSILVVDEDYGQLTALWAAPSEGGARCWAQNPDGWSGAIEISATAAGPGCERLPRLGAYRRATCPTFSSPRPAVRLPTAPYLVRGSAEDEDEPHTALRHPAPAGYELQGNQLRMSGRTVELGPGHAASSDHILLVEPKSHVVAVLSQRSTDHGIRHYVDRVVPQRGRAERIAEGFGRASARIGPDGWLYLHVAAHFGRGTELTEGVLRRYPLASGGDWQPTLAGLELY